MAGLGAYSSSYSVLATTGGGINPPQASLMAVLVASVGPASEEQSTSLFAATVARDGSNTPHNSQLAVLVAYGTNVAEDPSSRVWTFDLDGHTNYVLTLGDFGTYVYDLTTQQWAQWGTEGYTHWNAQRGTMWKDLIVAADTQQPQVYVIDPTKPLDQGFRPLRRRATAILPSTNMNRTSMDSVYVSASIGDGQTDFAGTAELTLSFSDDQGQSWVEFGRETVSSTDDSQILMYRSLGSFGRPGRIIRVEDLGGPVRLDGIDVVLR